MVGPTHGCATAEGRHARTSATGGGSYVLARGNRAIGEVGFQGLACAFGLRTNSRRWKLRRELPRALKNHDGASWIGAADRMHQCCPFDTGQERGAPERVCGALGDWSARFTIVSTIIDGKSAAYCGGGGVGLGACDCSNASVGALGKNRRGPRA